MNSNTMVTEYQFGNFIVKEKVMLYKDLEWRYTVSGNGKNTLLAILSNTTGHLLALPLAEEFRDSYMTIALSIPPMKSFLETAHGLKALLDVEGIKKCNAIGQSNGGVYLQNLIAHYPSLVNKVVFSHSLTSMTQEDVHTTNASEVKIYKLMRKMLKILPVSVFTSSLGRMVFKNLWMQSGQADTSKLISLCKEDFKRVTKKDFYTIADCMEDFLYNYTFTPEPYINQPENVLIVDSPTDKVANSMQRAELLKLCPGAQEHHFEQGGHVTIINCREEYFSLLHKFWDEP